MQVVDAALTYDCEYTGTSYVMVIRNALYLKEMKVSLILPFMMRLSGIEINECLKFLAKVPTIQHHSVYFPSSDIRLPLKLHGIILYLPVPTTTDEEISNSALELELTPNVPDWKPHEDIYQQQEESMLTFQGTIKERSKLKFIVSSVISRALDPVALPYDLTNRSLDQVYAIKTASGSYLKISPKQLAEIWNIGLETARCTLQVTTRFCPRSGEGITLNRRHDNNDCMIRYKHLSTNVFMDAMFASNL